MNKDNIEEIIETEENTVIIIDDDYIELDNDDDFWN